MKRLLIFTLVVTLTFQLCYGIEQTVSKDQAVFSVDEMPKFEGKDLTYFHAWVQRNIKRPKVLKKDDIAGRVLLSFIVERDGSLSDIQVIQSVNEYLSEEALRVVKSSPKWTPGKHQGELMRVKYIVPIDFRHAKLKHYTLRLNSPDATVNEGMITIRQKTKADSIEIDQRRKDYAEQRKGFGSMIDASATLGLLGKPRLCGGLSYIAGYRFNNQLFLGGGVGVNFNSNFGTQDFRTYDGIKRIPGGSVNTHLVSVPVFAYFRANFINRRCSPFFALAAGGNFTTKQTVMLNVCNVQCRVNKFFANPQFGINIRATTTQSVSIAIGVNSFVTPYCTEYTAYNATFRYRVGCGLDTHIGFTF